jgi:Xaa-Pro dipeptidase
VKAGLIYIPGLPFLDYEDSDQPVAFRQRRYFYYLSGLEFPGCAVTYDIGRDQLSAFIPPANYGSSVIFNGSNPTREEIKAKYDFNDVQRITNLAYCLASFIRSDPVSKIYVLHDYDSPQSLLRRIALSTGKDEKSRFDTTMLKPAMNAARVIKSPYELKMIRKASAITAQAHTNVLRAIKTLDNEAEIEAIFAATCISEQAKQQAYGIIAGAGSNASTLHYIANNESLKGKQLVCLDAGCEWKCYASDVTRTFPISGKWTKEGKEIYDLVARMQEECIAMVKPGANFRDIHFHAHKVAVDGLMKLGLLQNGTFEELYAARASVAFFPHGLGRKLVPLSFVNCLSDTYRLSRPRMS